MPFPVAKGPEKAEGLHSGPTSLPCGLCVRGSLTERREMHTLLWACLKGQEEPWGL